MANERNLKGHEFTSDQSREEAARNGRKGGIASGRARRERKTMQEIARIVLDAPWEGTVDDLDDVERVCFEEFPDKNLTVGQRAMFAAARKASRGDVNALAFLRDTAGERPADKVEVTGDVERAASHIRELVARRRSGDAGGG